MDSQARRDIARLEGRSRPDAVAAPATGPDALHAAQSRWRPFWGKVVDGAEVFDPPGTTYPQTGGVNVGYYIDELAFPTFAEFHPSRTRDAENVYVSLIAKPYNDGPNTDWAPLATDAIVLVYPFLTEAGALEWKVFPGASAGPITCLVTKDGGAVGGVEDPPGTFSACTWTYTVKALDDTTVLAEEQTPERARHAGTAYYYAGEGGRSRYALWSPTAAKLLMCFGEIEQGDDCD